MYHHVKKLMFTVRVDEPDVRFGNMLLEQFGGANGELAAAMQYSIQGLNCGDPERRKLKASGAGVFDHAGSCSLVGMRLEPRVE
jgi:Mn-containing catalase